MLSFQKSRTGGFLFNSGGKKDHIGKVMPLILILVKHFYQKESSSFIIGGEKQEVLLQKWGVWWSLRVGHREREGDIFLHTDTTMYLIS